MQWRVCVQWWMQKFVQWRLVERYLFRLLRGGTHAYMDMARETTRAGKGEFFNYNNDNPEGDPEIQCSASSTSTAQLDGQNIASHKLFWERRYIHHNSPAYIPAESCPTIPLSKNWHWRAKPLCFKFLPADIYSHEIDNTDSEECAHRFNNIGIGRNNHQFMPKGPILDQFWKTKTSPY